MSDHLPGGVYDNPSAQLEVETGSAPNTNVISERDFAKLDRLLREKTNASTITLQAMVLFSNNKTAQWLNSKPQAEVKVPEFKQLYKDRRKQMLEGRGQLLQAKHHALQAAQEKSLRRKEQLTKEILHYGLWQTHGDVENELAKLKSKSAKLKALKAQINFRKQKYPDKKVFLFSKNRRQFSVDELPTTLRKLISDMAPVPQDAHAEFLYEDVENEDLDISIVLTNVLVCSTAVVL